MRQKLYVQTKQCIRNNQPTYYNNCMIKEVTEHHINLMADYYDHIKIFEIVKHLAL